MTAFTPRIDGVVGDGDQIGDAGDRRAARLRHVEPDPTPAEFDPLSAPLSEVEAAAAASSAAYRRRSVSAIRHVSVDSSVADLAERAARAASLHRVIDLRDPRPDPGEFGHANNGYESDGYQSNGYEPNGYQTNGFEPNGYQSNGFEPNGYQSNGYEPNGYQSNGYEPNGYQSNGYEPNGFEPNGYQSNGYEPNGHQSNGFEPNGFEPQRFHSNGHEANGFHDGDRSDRPASDEYQFTRFDSAANELEGPGHAGRHGSSSPEAPAFGEIYDVATPFGGRRAAPLPVADPAAPIVPVNDELTLPRAFPDEATPLFAQTWSQAAPPVVFPPKGLDGGATASVLPPRPAEALVNEPLEMPSPRIARRGRKVPAADPITHDQADDTEPGNSSARSSRAPRGRSRTADPLAQPDADVTQSEAQSAVRLRPDARHRAVATTSSVHRRVRLGSAATVGVSLMIAFALWSAAGGASDLSAPASAVASLARLAGLFGSDLLLAQVVLGARVPLLERAFGRIELNRWYSVAGATSFALVVLHIGLSVSGTALVERFNVFEAAWRLVSTTRGVPLSVLGLVFLVLAAMSVRRDVKRHDTLRLLHVYCYAGLALALPHQLLAGSSLTASPLAAAYWWLLVIGVATTLVVFRFGLPLVRSLRHQLVVADVVSEGSGVVSIYLRGRQLRELGARAGEFFHWRFLDGTMWHQSVSHPLSALPTRDQLRITVPAGDRLASLTPGTWVLFEGPYGALTADVRTRPRVAFFACGFGIAQARALMEELEYARDEMLVVYRIPPGEPTLFRDELEDLSIRRGADVVYLDGPPPEDHESWLPASAAQQIGDVEAVGQLVPDIAVRDVFVMGPEEWTVVMITALTAAGVSRDQIHAESLNW